MRAAAIVRDEKRMKHPNIVTDPRRTGMRPCNMTSPVAAMARTATLVPNEPRSTLVSHPIAVTDDASDDKCSVSFTTFETQLDNLPHR